MTTLLLIWDASDTGYPLANLAADITATAGSGQQVRPPADPALQRRWNEHLADLSR